MNKLPKTAIDVVYVFSGVEKHRLIGSSKDRLEAGVKVWQKLAINQNPSPIFLFQGSSEWYLPVKGAFDKDQFSIPNQYLRLELVKSWKSTLDQFRKIPPDLKNKRVWLIVTSPWHLSRVRRYVEKWWPKKNVYYWASPYRKDEFRRYMSIEIKKIIEYAKNGDL